MKAGETELLVSMGLGLFSVCHSVRLPAALLLLRRSLPPWSSRGHILTCSGTLLTESLEGSPEGQMSPARLDILQGGNPYSTGTDCPHVPKDETVGKTDLDEQRAGSRTQVKKESLSHLEEGSGHPRGQQGCCEVITLR